MMKRLPFVLLSLVAAAMAVISLIPDAAGAYSSLPMVLLWAATAGSALYYMIRCRLMRRPAVFLLHLAFAVILAGALVTHVHGRASTVHIREGESIRIYGHKVGLVRFELENYPGTIAPRDYRSTVVVDGDTGIVSMNNVLCTASMRIFQSGFDADRKGSVLTVSCDSVGTAVTYTGYAMLLVAMLGITLRRFRRRVSVAALMLLASVSAWASPESVPPRVAESMGRLCVYSGGRIVPLSVFARNFTVALTGAPSYKGLTSEQVLSGWFFYYHSWKEEPCIKVRKSVSREALGADGPYVPLSAFVDASGCYLAEGQEHAAVNELFGLVSSASTGALWKLFPVETQSGTDWFSPVDPQPAELDVELWHFIRHSPAYLAEQLALGDVDGAVDTIEKIAAYQRKVLGDAMPSPAAVWCERVFASAADTVLPAVVVLICALVLFFFCNSRLSVVLAAMTAVWLVFLISLNWIASGSIPMTNGYETMQWMALAAALGGIALRRHRAVSPLCCVVSALAMLVAMLGHRTPVIEVVVPVLRSPLLSVHVLAVMIAYAAMALMALCGLAWFAGRKSLLALARRMLEPAVFFLAAGIFVGAVWANTSWGRYWGWDPKEVWALITMIIYSMALHGGTLKSFRSDRFFAAYTVIAFLAVVMTYFGVNLVLGGLHSYA